MAYNGSGTFLINTSGQPVVPNTVISATAFNALTNDLANGLSTCITKDGQTTPTANIPMGNNKITGLAPGTSGTDAANLSQVQGSTAKLLQSVTGTDTITAAMVPALTAYAAGQMFYFVAAGDNTGAVTINIDSLGAKSVTRDGSVALVAGDILSGEIALVVYDGTRFQLLNGNSFTNLNVSNNLTLSGGTANGVLYLNGSKVATSGSALVFDGTNLGIGTSSFPSDTNFTVLGNFKSGFYRNVTSGDRGYFLNIGAKTSGGFADGGYIFGAVESGDATGYLAFGTRIGGSTTERARIDSSGNLGLGVTPSAWGSVWKAQQLQAGAFIASQTNADDIIHIGTNAFANASNAWTYINTAAATRYQQYQGSHAWYNAPSGTAGNAISFTQAMTLDASANLFVGGTSTSTIPVLNRGVYLQSTTNNDVIGYSLHIPEGTNNRRGSMFLDDANGIFGWDVTASSGIPAYAWRSAGRTDMVLDASGNLGVGITSPNSRLDVVGGTGIRVNEDGASTKVIQVRSNFAGVGPAINVATNDPLLFQTNNTERARITSGGDFNFGVAATNAGVLYIQTGTGGTTGRIIDAVNSAGNRYFEVQTDGDVYNTNGTYGTISDARLKQDIVDAGSQWDDLKSIRFRKYRMKTDVEANPDAPAMFGVVAQELAQVCPGLVDEHPNMKTVEVTDEEGNVTQTQEPDGTTTLTVKSSILLMKAAKALQEAMARIEQLEADMAALKGAK